MRVLSDAATARGACDRMLKQPSDTILPYAVWAEAINALRLPLYARVGAQIRGKRVRNAAADAGVSGWRARMSRRRVAPRCRLAGAAVADKPSTRAAVGGNDNCPAAMSERLTTDKDRTVLEQLAANHSCNPATLDRLAGAAGIVTSCGYTFAVVGSAAGRAVSYRASGRR